MRIYVPIYLLEKSSIAIPEILEKAVVRSRAKSSSIIGQLLSLTL